MNDDIKQDNKLSKRIIEEKLSECGVSAKVFVHDVLDSTNAEAKRTAAGNTEPMLILAESQTAGRGRLGRSFYSPDGTGLYMSFMYCPETDFSDSVTVTSAAAVAVVRAIETLCGLEPKIKWVNDIYLNGKKICGILAEAVTGVPTHIIIGIGINITTGAFPEEIKTKASSIGMTLDRNLLAATVIKNLCELINGLPQRTFLPEYREKSMVLGREVEFIKAGVSRFGRAVGVDKNGGLIVDTENGRVTLSTGEISLKVIERGETS